MFHLLHFYIIFVNICRFFSNLTQVTKSQPLYGLQSFNPSTYDVLEGELVLLEHPIVDPQFFSPFKLNLSVAVFCARGSMQVKVNVKEFKVQAPCLLIMVSGQVVQYQEISHDCKSYYLVMSDRFTDELFSDLSERYPLRYAVLENPSITLSEPELRTMVEYFRMMREALKVKENPFRKEILLHLTRALFYRTTYQYHKLKMDGIKTKAEMLYDQFSSLVQQHFKNHREVEFYALELCITPKHLSKVLKERTGKTASTWISEHVMLEAKALLKSTNLSIQQISEELNFPSQSFFGKFFKQHSGVSPKVYRWNDVAP